MNWPSRKKVIENLINAGADINNVYGPRCHTHTQSAMELIFLNWSAGIDDSDDQGLQLVLNTNARFTMETMFAFLDRVRRLKMYRKELFEDAQAFEILKWGVQTNFTHFALDALPIFFTLILEDLAASPEPTKIIKCLLKIDFHKIIAKPYGTVVDCVLLERSRPCITKLEVEISVLIRILNEKAPHSFKRALFWMASHCQIGGPSMAICRILET